MRSYGHEDGIGMQRRGKNIFPDLVTTHRCSMHASQKSMENALETDNRVGTVIGLLIFRSSKPNTAKEPIVEQSYP